MLLHRPLPTSSNLCCQSPTTAAARDCYHQHICGACCKSCCNGTLHRKEIKELKQRIKGLVDQAEASRKAHDLATAELQVQGL